MKPIVLLTLVLFTVFLSIQGEAIQLKDWSFQIQGNSKSYPATIPSTLAQDLIKSGIVSSDPYYRDNILQFYQYETKNVNYTTYFAAPQNAQGSAISQLVFEGLDTHCDVFLNDVRILSAHNMFRRYVLNITNLVSSNKLVVAFYSSAKYDIQMAKQFYEEYDFSLPANYSFTRKAAYQYGWDWGPRILTVGIWKQCYIDFSLPVAINFFMPRLLSPIEEKHPKQIRFRLDTNLSQLRTDVAYNITYKIQGLVETIVIIDKLYFPHDSSIYMEYQYTLVTGGNVKNASKFVWWTWDLGQPNYFNLTLDLVEDIVQGRKFSKTIKTSFKTVTVMQDEDSLGKQFKINLNGFDLYIRGGNYIPPEMSMANINPATYTKIKQYALFAKYNMIRVWGGGQFQNEEFYSAMDDAGILIWHDLMFACAMYPVTGAGDQLQNIRKQMEDNLYRIGYHPSIGIWNGNNEVWIGWQQWGWKNGLNNLQIYDAQLMYKKIFHQILPEVIKKITPNIFYWQTSPSSSSNQVSTITSGDIHFWRVWGAGTPIQQYQQYVGRFNSQYGMQSMPEFSSIIKFTDSSDRYLNSFVLRLHQRHPYGDKYLPMYTQNYSGTTLNLKRYAYYTQVMQAYALEMAIVSLRGNKPFNMGSIYWQLNDVWPVSSWSTVDYYGRYKISHYRIRQLHNQLLVHVVHIPKSNKSEQVYKAFAVNEFDRKISLFTIIKVMDFNGTIFNSYQIQKTVSPFENLVLMRINTTSIPYNRSFININSKNPATGQSYENNYYFVPPIKRLALNPNLEVTPMTNAIKIKAKNLANYVWIRSKNEAEGINFEKNYFDLIPGQQILVNLPVSSLSVEVTSYQNEVLLGRQEEMLQRVQKLRSQSQ